MKVKPLIICLGLIALSAHTEQKNATSGVTSIRIQASPQLFRTLPFYVAVEITNGSQQAVEFPEWNVLQIHLPLTIHLKEMSGQEYSSPMARYGFIIDEVDTADGPVPIPRDKWQIKPGASRRILANIGSCFADITVTNGTYNLSICLWTDEDRLLTESMPVEITVFDRPNQALNSLISKSVLTVCGAMDIKDHYTPNDIKKLASKELRDNLWFTSLLHEVLTTKDISSLPIQTYRELESTWLLPEVQQIEFEVLLARHETNKAVLVKTAILKQFPAMKYWIDEAERDQGYCQTIRKLR